MKLFELRSAGVAREGDGVDVRSRLCKLPDKISGCLKSLVGEVDFEIADSVHFEDRHAVKSFLDRVDLYDEETFSRAISDQILRKFRDCVQRHAEACAKQESLVPTPYDRHALNLNQAAWEANKIGAELWLLPGTPEEWLLEPLDPVQLRCATPIEVASDHVEAAEVLGIREILKPQRDFWDIDDEIDVIVSLKHRIAEIRHKMTRNSAQSLWKGLRIISAEVCVRRGELPEVVGELVKKD